MAYTLKSVQKVLIDRLRVSMDLVEMDTSTTGVPNDDLQDPLTWSLRTMGYTLVDPLQVSEEEVVGVDVDRLSEMLDLAEYRLLKTIISQMSQTDERLGPHGKWNSQYPTRLTERLQRDERRLQREYGLNATTLSFGLLNIAELANDPSI